MPAEPGLADWQCLVAGTLAAYFAPLQTLPDGTPIPGAELADETDFGQADHVLAQLVDAGAYLPGVDVDALSWLRDLDLRLDQCEPSDDPFLSLTLVLPRSVIGRLTQAVSQGHGPNLAVLARAMILVGLDALPDEPATVHDTEIKEDPLTPPGRKPRSPTRTAVKPVNRRLHPLRSYTKYDTLRDLIAASCESPAHVDLGALVSAARAALNATLSLHGLRLGNTDVFFTSADYDHDSDLRIGEALAALDVDALAQQFRFAVQP